MARLAARQLASPPPGDLGVERHVQMAELGFAMHEMPDRILGLTAHGGEAGAQQPRQAPAPGRSLAFDPPRVLLRSVEAIGVRASGGRERDDGAGPEEE